VGCSVVGGEALCTGNQSAGIVSSNEGLSRLTVRELSSDIRPAPGHSGVTLESRAAKGGAGANCGVFNPTCDGGPGGAGATGSASAVEFAGGSRRIVASGDDVDAIFALSFGGDGGHGGSDTSIVFPAYGGKGGRGGNGGTVSITSAGALEASGSDAYGIFARSDAGDGGTGGHAGTSTKARGGDGGVGGTGGAVTVQSASGIRASGASAAGIVAQSFGGAGGDGGGAGGIVGTGGGASGSGPGGAVCVTNSGAIDVEGVGARGILAESVGGFAGAGGGSGGLVSFGGNAQSAGAGGAVTLENQGRVTSRGAESDALFAQSVGGGGGTGGGTGSAFFSLGGEGNAGGAGGAVLVTNSAHLDTSAVGSVAIFAQSVGGGGGDGGGAGSLVAIGGKSSAGGAGGSATVRNLAGGEVTTREERSHGIFAQSIGGGGGTAGGSGGLVSLGGEGQGGGIGAAIDITNDAAIETRGANARGLFGQSIGGGGGDGAGSGGIVSIGGKSSGGGVGGNASITNHSSIATQGAGSDAIFAQSVGGGGGTAGGSGGVVSVGGKAPGIGGEGTGGGNGGPVRISSTGEIETVGAAARAIAAQSIGGGGGDGAGSGGFVSIGGKGSGAGDGGTATITSAGRISTEGAAAHAIFAQSVGGGGGAAGGSGGLVSIGGSGRGGGSGDRVEITNDASIDTVGSDARGIYAQSLGGGGGAGAGSGGLVSLGGSGAGGGDGGEVVVANRGRIATLASRAHGIVVESIGGGGGSGGGAGGVVSIGGSGDDAGAGDGGAITLTNHGAIDAVGAGARGIFAQSVGGGGGNAAGSGGAISIGGKGGAAGNGGVVRVENDAAIHVKGSSAEALFAQSVGGGGGSGGASGGILSIGGSGAKGGGAAEVTVANHGALSTEGADSSGIFAQSVGGGGGRGGGSVAAGAAVSVSVGGSGGPGGSGKLVRVESVSSDAGGQPSIRTEGNGSAGIHAQSVGGGGGHGGFSVAAAAGPEFSASLAIGGSGGIAGSGDAVEVAAEGRIETLGKNSHGIFAESLGGGGGSGGFAVSVAGSDGLAAAVSLGGKGKAGGDGRKVDVESAAAITTWSDRSYAILAQSVGGGGGDGGFSVSAAGGSFAGSFGLGGSGAAGGKGGLVTLRSGADLETHGTLSYGAMAQSVGGGGGSGGFSVSGALGTGGGALGVSLGGGGGPGVESSRVVLESEASVETRGRGAHALFAQSVGGGGGSGGFSGSVAANLADGASLTAAVGGKGGQGGNAGSVRVDATGERIATEADGAYGILAQSLGGGGGDAGFGLAAAVGTGEKAVNLGVAIGGKGGSSGTGSRVDVSSASAISTKGAHAHGIFAQSTGGGGGSGGFAVAGSLGLNPAANTSAQLSVGIGGSAGAGNDADEVSVASTGSVATAGDEAAGIRAQSIGGGGGDGGFSFAGSLGGSDAKNLAVSVGGAGGDGGSGKAVTVTSHGEIRTAGRASEGIHAESIGGGGGSGGLTVAAALAMTGNNTNVSATVGVGGAAGDGRTGGSVTVQGTGAVTTSGAQSAGVYAHSIGGGGGTGGAVVQGVIGLDPGGAEGTTYSAGFVIGGKGGAGNTGGDVKVERSGAIETSGADSAGIFAQSVGGGGGAGGRANSLSFALSGECTLPIVCQSSDDANHDLAISVTVGGNGGGSSNGGNVTVLDSGAITTRGTNAHGIFAQSVGGGGGTGGNSVLGTDGILELPEWLEILDELDELRTAYAGLASEWDATVGGSGGSSGNGGEVSVVHDGLVRTSGYDASGIYAQSVGGGGGVGGSGAAGLTGKLSIAGGAGSSGDGASVSVRHGGAIETQGDRSHGIFAQSVGGGGGVSGNVDRWLGSLGINAGIGVALGRDGSNAGKGGDITVVNDGDISVRGVGARGVFAESVGGGGGDAGDLGRGPNLITGSGGGAGDGGKIDVTTRGAIRTQGASGAHGIFAHSVGGGGGAAGGFFGSIGGDGRGGDVAVRHAGVLSTLGAESHGIFAQSAGGGSTATNTNPGGRVDVTLDGDISVAGVGSDGIRVQSRGGLAAGSAAAHGNLGVDVLGGRVEGGTGEGAGVRFVDGAANTLRNRGVVSALGGLAVAGGSGSETIENQGIVRGNLALGGGTNLFHNQQGGLLLAGSRLDLGPGVLRNDGVLSLSGASDPQATTLTGDLVQSASGAYESRVRADGGHDELRVTGRAALGGAVKVLPARGLYRDGTSYRILSAGAVEGSFSPPVFPSARPLLGFSLATGPTEVEVTSHTRPFAFVASNEVERAVARYLDALAPLAQGDLADVMGDVQQLESSQFSRAYSSLSADSYDDATTATLIATRAYEESIGNRLLSRRAEQRQRIDLAQAAAGEATDVAAPPPDTEVGDVASERPRASRRPSFGPWLDGFGQWGNQAKDDGYIGYHYGLGGTTLGMDTTVGDHFLAGGSLGFAYTHVGLSSGVGSSNVQSGFASLYGTWLLGRAYLQPIVTVARNRYDNRRYLDIGSQQSTAESDYAGYTIAASLGAGVDLSVAEWTVNPHVGVHYGYVSQDSFSESGAGPVSLDVDGRQTNAVLSELGVRVSHAYPVGAVTVVPEVMAAWWHDFDADSRVVRAIYAGASTPGPLFALDGRNVEADSARIGVRVRILGDGPVSGSLRFDTTQRPAYSDYTAMGSIEVRF
jgi:uncharacterized protein YhjY with autotransporter beta-barrel domain